MRKEAILKWPWFSINGAFDSSATTLLMTVIIFVIYAHTDIKTRVFGFTYVLIYVLTRQARTHVCQHRVTVFMRSQENV